MIANTPKPPYYAVIFTTQQTETLEGYAEMAEKMDELAKEQEGYLGIESARSEVGITISYWASLESIRAWKHHVEHTIARDLGRERWYQRFKTRICKVERDYEFEKS